MEVCRLGLLLYCTASYQIVYASTITTQLTEDTIELTAIPPTPPDTNSRDFHETTASNVTGATEATYSMEGLEATTPNISRILPVDIYENVTLENTTLLTTLLPRSSTPISDLTVELNKTVRPHVSPTLAAYSDNILDMTPAPSDVPFVASDSNQTHDMTSAISNVPFVTSDSNQTQDMTPAISDVPIVLSYSNQTQDMTPVPSDFPFVASDSNQTQDITYAISDVPFVASDSNQIQDMTYAISNIPFVASDSNQTQDMTPANSDVPLVASDSNQIQDMTSAISNVPFVASDSNQTHDMTFAISHDPIVPSDSNQTQDTTPVPSDFPFVVSDVNQTHDITPAISGVPIVPTDSNQTLDMTPANSDVAFMASNSSQTQDSYFLARNSIETIYTTPIGNTSEILATNLTTSDNLFRNNSGDTYTTPGVYSVGNLTVNTSGNVSPPTFNTSDILATNSNTSDNISRNSSENIYTTPGVYSVGNLTVNTSGNVSPPTFNTSDILATNSNTSDNISRNSSGDTYTTPGVFFFGNKTGNTSGNLLTPTFNTSDILTTSANTFDNLAVNISEHDSTTSGYFDSENPARNSSEAMDTATTNVISADAAFSNPQNMSLSTTTNGFAEPAVSTGGVVPTADASATTATLTSAAFAMPVIPGKDCSSGYRKLSSQCVDIDECFEQTSKCNPTTEYCNNTAGSYSCVCNRGFRRNENQSSCTDINECESKPCDQQRGVCINTIGSFLCSCGEGFSLAGDEKTCRGNDTCVSGLDGCQESCTYNTSLSLSLCGCQPGLKLTPDGKSCIAEVPCSDAALMSICPYICTKISGVYDTCLCPFGSVRYGTSCTVYDQCAVQNPCDPYRGICNMTAGSFSCSCKDGYELGPGYTCIDRNGGWSAWSSWTQCSVTCNAGTMQRTRLCNNPTPDGAGALCSGNSIERQTCNTQQCSLNEIELDYGTFVDIFGLTLDQLQKVYTYIGYIFMDATNAFCNANRNNVQSCCGFSTDYAPNLNTQPIKTYMTPGGIKTVSNYPIEVGNKHSKALIVLTVNQSNELCLEAEKTRSPGTRRKRDVALGPDMQPVARDIVSAVMTSQTFTDDQKIISDALRQSFNQPTNVTISNGGPASQVPYIEYAPNPTSSSKLETWAILLIVIPILAVLIIVGVVVYALVCRKKKPLVSPNDGSAPLVSRPSTPQTIMVQEKDSNPQPPLSQDTTQALLKESNPSTSTKESLENKLTGTAENVLSGTTNSVQSVSLGIPLAKLSNSNPSTSMKESLENKLTGTAENVLGGTTNNPTTSMAEGLKNKLTGTAENVLGGTTNNPTTSMAEGLKNKLTGTAENVLGGTTNNPTTSMTDGLKNKLTGTAENVMSGASKKLSSTVQAATQEISNTVKKITGTDLTNVRSLTPIG